MVIQLIRAVAAILTIIIIGCGLLLAILRDRPMRGLGPGLALSIGLGFGFLAECSLVFLAIGRKMSFAPVRVAVAAGVLVIMYGWMRRRPDMSGVARCRRRKTLVLAASVVVVIVLALVTINLMIRPMYQFDSRAIWGMKAKILFHEQTIFSDAVMQLSRNHPHPRYPLLVPISMAWVFESMGEADDRLVRIVFLAFFAGLVAGTHSLMRLGGRISAALSLAAMVTAPFLYSATKAGASSGYADVPLTFYITTSALAMLMWLKRGERGFGFLAAALATCGILTKNEGIVYVGNLFVCTAVVVVFGNRREGAEAEVSPINASSRMMHLALFAGAAVLFLVPWLVVRTKLPTFLDEHYARHVGFGLIFSGLDRLPLILKTFGAELVNLRNWGLVWILAALSMLRWNKSCVTGIGFLCALVLLQLACYAAIFVITPNDPAAHMRDSLPRLLLHVLPLTAAVFSFNLAGVISPLFPSDPLDE
jgi:hypothetical protein